jgi:hypothetical protein
VLRLRLRLSTSCTRYKYDTLLVFSVLVHWNSSTNYYWYGTNLKNKQWSLRSTSTYQVLQIEVSVPGTVLLQVPYSYGTDVYRYGTLLQVVWIQCRTHNTQKIAYALLLLVPVQKCAWPRSMPLNFAMEMQYKYNYKYCNKRAVT